MEVLDDIRYEQSIKKEAFIEIDASKLKKELIDQGQQLITQIFDVLLKQSKKDLQEFLKAIKDPIDELKQPIDTDERLQRNRVRVEQLENNRTALQAKINPIKQKFMFLTSDDNSEHFDAQLTEEEKEQLKELDEAWKNFEKGLKDVKENIRIKFSEMKSSAEQQLDDFKKEILELRDSFTREAPKDKSIKNEDAQAKIRDFAELCEKKREMEEQYKFKEEVFGIDHQDYKELASVERENSVLKRLWDIKDEWDGLKREWYPLQFFTLNTSEMDTRASEVVFEIGKVCESLKEAKGWPLTEALKQEIKVLTDTIPLIEDLMHPSMRERHWNDLRLELKDEFR